MSLAERILSAGLDDWVSLYDVEARCAVAGFQGADARSAALAALHTLPDEGWIEIGSVTRDGFARWAEEGSDALVRVAAVWTTEPATSWGFDAWINNTADGDERARSLPLG